ncbi:MAG TPA: family 20 glycosylhydrolase, partial [Thermoanaerobaculia bacterium]|nr:family 20 glycosylhydrolase [Thermoanaerobaculia bacterium]
MTADPAKALLVVEAAAGGPADPGIVEDESYLLDVTSAGARLRAPGPLGVLRGLETFLQLVRTEDGRAVLPALTIEDRPRFPWRGLLLDVGRHFVPVDVVKRNLDAMAAVKLNVLHWHLTEDQGFRVESRLYPELTANGSDGLFYTQDQIRDVVACARERGIRVVPEFDMPGHVTAWLAGRPDLGSAPGPYPVERAWGVFDPAFDPTREEVYRVLDAFLGEMALLFPDGVVHLGGDEVTGRHWNANPGIQEFLYANGLRENGALQARFTARMEALLRKRGKRLAAWDEVLHGSLPPGQIVQVWRGAGAIADAARQGHDVLRSHGWYLDHLQSAAVHYGVDPVPAGTELSPAAAARILGGEACMWTEYVSAETLDARLWPRLAAVAERLWSPAEVADVADMYRRLEIESARLEAFGLTHRSSLAPMLARLVGPREVARIEGLAALVEPAGTGGRARARAVTQQTPLTSFADAVRPESREARELRSRVDRYLAAAPAFRPDPDLRRAFET